MSHASSPPEASDPWRLSAEGQPHPDHLAARIDERRRPAEIRAEQVVCCDSLFGGVIERAENVEKELDSIGAAELKGARQTHIKQRLRRESARTAVPGECAGRLAEGRLARSQPTASRSGTVGTGRRLLRPGLSPEVQAAKTPRRS